MLRSDETTLGLFRPVFGSSCLTRVARVCAACDSATRWASVLAAACSVAWAAFLASLSQGGAAGGHVPGGGAGDGMGAGPEN